VQSKQSTTISGSDLGELQPAYNALQKSLSDYNYFLTTDYHNKKIATIRRQIDIQQILLNQGYRQLKLQKEQLHIADLQFSRDSILFVQTVIAAAEYEKAKSTKLQAYQSYESTKTALESQKISILQLEQAIVDLEQQRAEQEAQHKLSINTTFDQLKAQLQSFKKTYFLESPSDGIVTFTKYWQPKQNLRAGDVVLTIVPEKEEKITGKIYLSPQGAGKVKIGQSANIKFDSYPYLEYGLIKVQIKNIALVPIVEGENRFYVLEVDFPEHNCTDALQCVSTKLITNYGKTITFSQQMTGTAEIITEDLRLIDRFLNPIKAIIKR
jgi:HlyD family secretion protein